MSEALVPYSFDTLTEYPHAPATVYTGQVQGVYITLHPEAMEAIAEKMERWFAGREEVEIVDVGTSDKQGFGFILIEWLGYDIDPLFLAILRDEGVVGDYTVYGRALD
jgi:hypothetical protein